MNTTESKPPSLGPVPWPMIVLASLSLPILFFGLGSYSLVNGDEGFYHYAARNMVETGDWTRLEFTGEHRIYDTFMNAPIQYWARALVILAFGDSYWTMRILSALFGLLSVLMTYRLVDHLAGWHAALLAGLIQLTTFQFVYMHGARTGELEPVICFVLTLTAYLFIRAVETDRGFVPHHLCLIVLLNLKVPLLIVPVLAELGFFAVTPAARSKLRAWLLAGAIVPLGFVWHAAQYFTLGHEAVEVMLRMGEQASGSGVGKATDARGNLAFYAHVLAFGGFPYTLCYLPAIAWLLLSHGDTRETLGLRLLLVYPAAVAGFFVVVAKYYAWYVIPVYPFLSALLGIWLTRLASATRHGWLAAVAIVTWTSMVWIRVEALNPFADRIRRDLPEIGLRDFMHPALGATLLALLLALLMDQGRRRLGARWPTAVSYALAATLLSVALVRVVRPLTHLPYVSQMESLHHELAGLRAAGEPFEFPYRVRESGSLKARYFFGDEFEIVRKRPASGSYFHLVGERTPD